MKITSTLSIATLALAGLFATGCSQQQVDGGSQVAGTSQQVADSSQSASQSASQAASSQQVQTAPVKEETPEPAPEPAKDPNSHTHPPVPNCTDSITHTHPNGASTHNHRYGCKGNAAGGKWTHTHPARPKCTNSVTHTHKYNNRQHSHKYSCGSNNVDVHALQRKLKAKGYYKGPINGVVTPETRSALQKYMQNR